MIDRVRMTRCRLLSAKDLEIARTRRGHRVVPLGGGEERESLGLHDGDHLCTEEHRDPGEHSQRNKCDCGDDRVEDLVASVERRATTKLARGVRH